MDKVKCVLLDIEGTICPISFVKDTLFPYALKALPEVLSTKWDDEEFETYREAFPADAKESPEAFEAHVKDLTERDVKIASLKNFQGYLWQTGYETGAYSTPLFTDVVPQLKKWHNGGTQIAVYSSGSVFAQKLLFGHVSGFEEPKTLKRKKDEADKDDDVDAEEESSPKKQKSASSKGTRAEPISNVVDNSNEEAPAGNGQVADGGAQSDYIDPATKEEIPSSGSEDLQYLVTDWFDTVNAGIKQESSSYTKIAEALKIEPSSVLFLSDNVKEVDGAIKAGMLSLLVDRPGNAPVSTDDRARLTVVESFAEINLMPIIASGGLNGSAPSA